MSDTFFRGAGPLISIILPSRGRSAHLLESLRSLYSTAIDRSQLEFLLKIDEDDTESQEVAKQAAQESGCVIKMWTSPRGNGYRDFHHWINSLAGVAEGDWLFLFNDDARMKTQGWDYGVLNAPLSKVWHKLSEVCIVVISTIGRPAANEFPLIRRDIYKILGHLSLNPHVDNWIHTVVFPLGCAYRFPEQFAIEHPTIDSEDVVRRETMEAYQSTDIEYHSAPMIRARLQDSLKLLDYIEKHMKGENEN